MQPRLCASYIEMANLSQNYYNIILKYTLDSSLDYLHSLLWKTEKVCDTADNNFDKRFQKVIVELLVTLFLSKAANYLFLQIENWDLAFDLLKLYKCI